MTGFWKFLCLQAIIFIVSSCSGRSASDDALTAVGDHADKIIVIDVAKMAKQLKEVPYAAEFPEIKAIMSLHGADLSRVVAISYTPSLSAMVMSVINSRQVDRSLGEAEYSDAFVSVHRIGPETYFVVDTAWIWMVDSRAGATGAAGKVAKLREQSASPLASWKREALLCKSPEMNGNESSNVGWLLLSCGGGWIESTVQMNDHGGKIYARCVDERGEPQAWFGGRWKPLEGRETCIDTKCAISLAMGPLNKGDSALNIAVETLTPHDFRLIVKALQGGLHELKSLRKYERALPQDTAYARCNLVASIRLSAAQLDDLGFDDMPEMVALAVVKDSDMDVNVEFIDSEKSFLENLVKFLTTLFAKWIE